MTAEGQRKHRRHKRSLGMCGWHGCKVLSGKDYHCEIHAAAEAARIKLLRQKARLAA
jgi:hypothetical protein